MASVKIEYRTLKDGSKSVRLKIYDQGKLNRETLPIRIYKTDSPTLQKKKIRDIEALRAKREYEIFFKPQTLIKVQDHLLVVPEFHRLIKELNVVSIGLYEAAVMHFDNYFITQVGGGLKFRHLDGVQLQNFLDYLYTKVSINSANLYYSKILRLLKDCHTLGMMHKLPSRVSKKSRTKSQGKDILLIDEFRALRNVNYEPVEQWDIKKAMTLSFYTGIGLTDAKIFNRNLQIRSGYFYYNRAKTGTPVKIAIPESVIKILPERFRLPQRPTTNNHIKVWTNMAEIDKQITFYSMRHSFAVAHRLAGTPLELLSLYLGHSKVSMTIEYLSRFVELQMDREGVRIPEL